MPSAQSYSRPWVPSLTATSAIRSAILSQKWPGNTQRTVSLDVPLAYLIIRDRLTRNADDAWPELLSSLFQLSQATEPEKRECAYRVFATTPAIIEKQHESTVLEAFQKGFTDDAVLVSGSNISPVPDLIKIAGSPRRHRSFRRILPSLGQEIPRQILRADS